MDSLNELNRRDREAFHASQAERNAERFAGAERSAQQLHTTLGGQPSSATRMPPRPNGQPYFQPGGFSDAKAGALAGIFAPILYACYMAAARQGVSYGAAMRHALGMVWIWKSWMFTTLYWVISGASIWLWMGAEAKQGDPATDYRTYIDTSFHVKLLVLHVLLLLPAILLPYCHHVDESFFQKRALYTVLSPIHKVTSWIPWFVLQSTALLPLLIIIQYRW